MQQIFSGDFLSLNLTVLRKNYTKEKFFIEKCC